LSHKDPDSLNLSKQQILQRLEKIQKNIMGTKEGKVKEVKFKLVFGFIRWLVDHYDLDVLNKIFMGIITEFDDMRFQNALESDDPIMQNYKKITKDLNNKK